MPTLFWRVTHEARQRSILTRATFLPKPAKGENGANAPKELEITVRYLITILSPREYRTSRPGSESQQMLFRDLHADAQTKRTDSCSNF